MDTGAPIPLEFKEISVLEVKGKIMMWYHFTPFAYRQQTSSTECVRDVFEIVGESLLYPVPYSIRLEAWACEGTFDPRRLAEKMLKSFRDFPPPGPAG